MACVSPVAWRKSGCIASLQTKKAGEENASPSSLLSPGHSIRLREDRPGRAADLADGIRTHPWDSDDRLGPGPDADRQRLEGQAVGDRAGLNPRRPGRLPRHPCERQGAAPGVAADPSGQEPVADRHSAHCIVPLPECNLSYANGRKVFNRNDAVVWLSEQLGERAWPRRRDRSQHHRLAPGPSDFDQSGGSSPASGSPPSWRAGREGESPLVPIGRQCTIWRRFCGKEGRAEMVSAETKSVIDRAKEIYASQFRTELESQHVDRFVAIEPESGEVFLGRYVRRGGEVS